MKINILILLMALLSVIVGCNLENNIYIGGYNDASFCTPTSDYVEIKLDSFYKFDFDKNLLEQNSFDADSIKLKLDGDVLTIFDFRGQKKYNSSQISRYIKLDGNSFKESNIDKILAGKLWHLKTTHGNPNKDFIIDYYLNLKSKKSAELVKKYSFEGTEICSEIEKISYKLLNLENKVLLNLYNPINKKTIRNYLISDHIQSSFILKNLNSLEVTYDTLVQVLNPVNFARPNSREVMNCNYSLLKQQYFGGRSNYSKGSKGLILEWKKLNKAYSTSTNGYVTINFDVNCNNQLGNFGLEIMSLNFEPIIVKSEIIEDLFSLTIGSDWNIDNSHYWFESNELNEIHAYLTFKIENGQLVDVVP